MTISLNSILTLPGYHILEEVYLGSRTVVYKGIREDQVSVIIKLMRNEYPTFNEVAQFRNQYIITKSLNLPGVIKTYSLENYRNGYALVMEDFDGVSLQDIGKLQQEPNRNGNNFQSQVNNHRIINNLLKFNNQVDSISCFLHIAIQVATALDAIHRNRIIHKDIKPANILINPKTLEVKIIDFSIASLLPKEVKQLTNPDLLEGTLAYLSPEQTGRMNRALDYRTDFYSLGVTFYELLTGMLPFTSNDPIELIYCHLTKQARPIQSINSNLPDIICEIVCKLMAKNAEARYQSALGLKHDLEVCFCSWQQLGRIVHFELGQKDISDRFLIPEKLYGRETQVETLLAAFERTSIPPTSPLNKGGSSGVEMVLVTGFSGVGKTAVVNEVHKPIVKNRGYFIQGKFDQFQRDIPFAALVQAFRGLIGQLLSETEAKIEHWKAKILAALKEQAQVIIEIIPELEIIIGKQPQVSELSGSAALNRFNLLFQKFIHIFAAPQHPLVIFIDDLQWADTASLKLIQLLMSGADISSNRSAVALPLGITGSTEEDTAKSLLLIGAYRNNEVDESHPLNITIKEIQKTDAIVNFITLEPLTQAELNRLIADTLHHQEVDTTILTQMVFAKTKGNPFFVNQFLKYLSNEKAIQFNSETVRWEYELDKVKALSFTDDVVEFMAKELKKLPLSTQSLLKYAACVGNEFDVKTLVIINQESLEDVTTKLWDALLQGLIISKSEICNVFYESHNPKNVIDINTNLNYKYNQEYKFVHDRVQQAAYSLISKEEKQLTHLKIGNILLTNTPISQREEKIFELVKQFNVAIDLIIDQVMRDELAEMNLTAGRRAMTSTAYSAALNYLTTGIDLLAENTWEKKYELTLALYETAAEAAYLRGEFERAEQFIEIVLAHAKTLLEKIKVYEVRTQAYGAQNQPLKAVNNALEVLKLLGIDFPENPNQSDIQLAIAEITSKLSDTSIEGLIGLPKMVECEPLAAIRILSGAIAFAYHVFPEIMPLMCLKQIDLSITHGNAPLSALAYAAYGFILCSILEDIETGYRFGQLAENLASKFEAREVTGKVLEAFNHLIKHCKKHIKETFSPLIEAYFANLEVGDLEFAAYSINGYSEAKYFVGEELTELEKDIANKNYAIKQIKQERNYYHVAIYRQAVLKLIYGFDNSYQFIGEAYNEDEMLPLHLQANDGVALLNLYFCKLQLFYLFGDYSQALVNSMKAEAYLYGGIGKLVTAQYYFYDSLTRLAIFYDVEQDKQQEIIQRIATNQEKMQKWAHHAPMNYLHKYYLVEAERYRILNQNLEAIESYERAISLAKEHEFIHEEALANELGAKFYLEWGKNKIAQAYMTDAYYCYVRWGAKAKVNDLLQRYPQLLAHIIQKETFSPPSIQDSSSLAQISLSTNSQQTIMSSYTSISKYLDIATIIKASQALSQKIEFEELLSTLIQVVMENAGASKCALILIEGEDSGLIVSAIGTSSVSTSISTEFPFTHLDDSEDVPISLINYVKRTKEIFVFDDARDVASLAGDSYMIRTQPKSLLCTPITNQGKLLGILYLENNATLGTFSRDRIQILNLLITQAAISLENARLYKNLAQANKSLEEYNHTLEDKVEIRTQELNSKNQHLKQALDNLQNTQTQLIQSEKMSSLGQMVAGIAHEINNPINFIHGNITHASNYIHDLLALVTLYQQEYSPTRQIQEKHEEIDIDFLAKDLSKILDSMRIGSSRIRNIVLSLRNFSRLDEAEMKPADIHEGIDNTLMILQHRLKTKSYRPEIEVIKEYAVIPQVNCYPGQLNQVFMNIFSNGIDALDELANNNQYLNYKPEIRICTELIDSNWVVIRITDNGCGISQQVIQKIFDPFFTTKAVGNGTGLGLSISYQIVVNKHKGKLTCNSSLGKGTEFVIAIPMY